MRRPCRSGKLRQVRIRDLQGVVALKKERTKYTAQDLVQYKSSLETYTEAQVLVRLLKELFCIETERRVIEESEIEVCLTELVFHHELTVAEAATNVLLHWRGGDGNRAVPLKHVKIGGEPGVSSFQGSP